MDIPKRFTRWEVLVGFASGAALVVTWPTSTASATTVPTAVDLVPTGSVTLGEFMDLSRVLTDDVAGLPDQVGAQYQEYPLG